MKALVYSKQEGKFSMREVNKPAQKKGEVLIRVHASSINAADYRTRKLGIGPRNGIYGADVAGTVASLGEGAKKFAIGDAVQGDIATEGFGAFAEYVAVREELLARIPEGVSFESAAATTLSGGTALQAVRFAGQDLTGKRVLIIGASGGVGTYAVQLAHLFGAEVTGVTSARNIGQTLALGAKFALDYEKTDCLSGNTLYDLILVVQGNRRPTELRRALAQGGIAVIVGGALKRVFQVMLLGWLYSGEKKHICVLAAKPNAADTEKLMGYVAQGSIKPVIEQVVELKDAGEAFELVARGHASGKTVVRVTQLNTDNQNR